MYPRSDIVTAALAKLREIESEQPRMRRFDETSLPPKMFVVAPDLIPGPAEIEWTDRCAEIIRAHLLAELVAVDERMAALQASTDPA